MNGEWIPSDDLKVKQKFKEAIEFFASGLKKTLLTDLEKFLKVAQSYQSLSLKNKRLNDQFKHLFNLLFGFNKVCSGVLSTKGISCQCLGLFAWTKAPGAD